MQTLCHPFYAVEARSDGSVGESVLFWGGGSICQFTPSGLTPMRFPFPSHARTESTSAFAAPCPA